jgi:hypothetical protein
MSGLMHSRDTGGRIMNTWLLYLVLQLSSLRITLAVISAVLFAVSVAIGLETGSSSRNDQTELRKKGWRFLYASLIVFSFLIIVPSTKTALTVWAVDYTTHNERVIKNVDATLDNVEQLGGLLVNSITKKLEDE